MRSGSSLDLGTVGEFKMFGITLPGLDIIAMDEDDRVKIKYELGTIFAIRLMDNWGLTITEEANILDVTASTIKRYAKGVIPKSIEQRNRVRDIILMHKALLVMFSSNKNMRAGWVTAANENFNGQSAAEYMADNGTESVRNYLEAQLFS